MSRKILISKFKHNNYNFEFKEPIVVSVGGCERGQVKLSNEYFEIYARGINYKVALTNFKINFITGYRFYTMRYLNHLAPSVQELTYKFSNDVIIPRRKIKYDEIEEVV